MKTNFQKIASLVILVTLLFSCSKDDDNSTFTSEDFLNGYLGASGFNQVTNESVNVDLIRFGVIFTPLVDGKIIALKVKLPDTNDALKITVWDVATETVIRTETVNLNTANVMSTFEINEINLIKDKSYAITVISDDYYDRSKTDGSDATYPIVSGNIQIEEFIVGSGSSTDFTFFAFQEFYLGDVSFKFQKIE